MIRIYDWINEVNSKRNRVILGILAGLCYLLMYLIMTGVFTDFNTYYVLDLKFFYTGDEFLIILGSISDAQASVYQVFHYIDYLFVLSFYPLFVLILDKFVVSKKKLIFIPLIAMLFDFFENLLIDIHLHQRISLLFADLSGVFTLLKFILIFAGFVVLLLNYYQNRKN